MATITRPVIQRIDRWPAFLLRNFSGGLGRCKLPALTSPRSNSNSRCDSVRGYSLVRSCGSAKVNVHVTIGHPLVGLWIGLRGDVVTGAPPPLSCIPPVVMRKTPQRPNWTENADNADEAEISQTAYFLRFANGMNVIWELLAERGGLESRIGS